jgi:hypothetical protein
LERTVHDRVPAPVDTDAEPITDNQEADRIGEFLWMTADWDGHSRLLARDPRTADKAALFRARVLVAKAARAAGHTACHAGLWTQAMAVWRTKNPDILQYERKRVKWNRPASGRKRTADARGVRKPDARGHSHPPPPLGCLQASNPTSTLDLPIPRQRC